MRRINEIELNRLTKKILNESTIIPDLKEDMDSLRMIVRVLGNVVEDYDMNKKKGNYKQMSDDLDSIRNKFKRFKDIMNNFESKIYRN